MLYLCIQYFVVNLFVYLTVYSRHRMSVHPFGCFNLCISLSISLYRYLPTYPYPPCGLLAKSTSDICFLFLPQKMISQNGNKNRQTFCKMFHSF